MLEPIPFAGYVEIADELTDEEILDCFIKIDPSEECWISDEQLIEFAKAILIKAQQK